MSLAAGFPDIETLDRADDLEHYGRDWTRFWPPRPSLIAFPRSTADVQALVRWARHSGVGLVPSGGRTGLSGGAVASGGEVVVSFDRMRAVLGLDAVDGSLRVQAGVSVGELQRVAAEAGWYYPVDWAAAGSSQVGGSIATNAGGIRVLRYGMTRRWVRALTVVDGRGERLDLGRGLLKNNAGYDLRELFIGSEGTLGLITEAELALCTPPPPQQVMLLGFSGLDAVMPAFAELRRRLVLSAFEFFDARSVAHVAARSGLAWPLSERYPFHAIVEFDCADEAAEAAALAAFESLLEAGHVLDGAISQSGAQAAELWRWREDISESLAVHTPYKNDLSVRVSRVPVFLSELDALVAREYPGFEVVWFGHIGDGNLHMNVLKPAELPLERFRADCARLSEQVFALVARHDGSLSAEHGVGLLKRDALQQRLPAAEYVLMQGMKRLFDPDGILNPGKVLLA